MRNFFPFFLLKLTGRAIVVYANYLGDAFMIHLALGLGQLEFLTIDAKGY